MRLILAKQMFRAYKIIRGKPQAMQYALHNTRASCILAAIATSHPSLTELQYAIWSKSDVL